MSGATPSAGYQAVRAAAGLIDRRDAGVVVVGGADGRAFLQSLVSQDLDPVVDGGGCASLLLQPTGKMGVAFRLLALGDELWLDTEAGFGEPLAAALARYVIRVDVEVVDHSATMGVLALRGPGAAPLAAELVGSEIRSIAHAHVAWGDLRVVRADRPGLSGVDVVGPLAALDEAEAALAGAGAVPVPAEDWETLRIEEGIPRLGVDLTEDVIPQEAFLEVAAVSFDKGCFLGQELVCRIKDRGHVNRHLRRLRVTGGAPPVGAEVWSGDKVVGSLTSVASPPRGSVVALGYLRREIEPGTAVVLRWGGGGAAAAVEEVPVPE